MNCPDCSTEMEDGFLYVRGIGSFLAWSSAPDVKLFSRKGLRVVDLTEISRTPTGGQAVLEAGRCSSCKLISFRMQET